MKTCQLKSFVENLALSAALGIVVGATAHAQPQITAAQVKALTPLSPWAIPKSGTFYLLNGPDPGRPTPPYPCLPSNLTNLPVFSLDMGNRQFLVDDSTVDWQAVREAEQQAMAANVAALDGPQPLGPQPLGPQPGDIIDYVWFELARSSGTNGPQLTAYTADWGGGWPWGIARGTNIGDYDPRECSWELMDPNWFTYDLDGGIFTFDMPPFDKPLEFYRPFDTDDYFAGTWTPIKYLGCNIPDGDAVTTNDVVMRFDLKGDIYKLLKDPNLAVKATVVRPSGESMGCFFEIATNGIATVTAPAAAFASGLNTVWVGFVNEGPQYADFLPDQPPDDTLLASMTLPDGSPDVEQQEAYLLSLGVDPPGTGNITNQYPHEFTGYLQFWAAPPLEDTLGSPYITPNWNGTTFSRTYRCQGHNANITVRLLTPGNQLIAQTNGVTQLDMNSDYTFEADLNIPDDTLANLDSFIADVQAQALDANGNPDTNQPPAHMVVPYIIDKTKFLGMYNTVAWCSMNYGVPFPGWNPYKDFWWLVDQYMDGFMSHAANAVLTEIGLSFQTGFSPAIPDPYVLNLIPAYNFTGTPQQFAHFSAVLTNPVYMGINFISHTTGGVSLFDDNLDLGNLSTDAGNRPGYFLPGGSGGGALTNYYSYKRVLGNGFAGFRFCSAI